MMNRTLVQRVRRQVIGKRVGLDSYYGITEHTTDRLVLESPPHANRKAGYTFATVGGTLLLLSLSLFCISYISSMGELGPFLMGMICSWPFGVLGGVAIIGGLAIAKTINTITIDAHEQKITYMQKSRRARTQHIDFAEVDRVRLSWQRFVPPGIFVRPRQIAVVELLTNDDDVWVVDSATDPTVLVPIATALAEMVGVKLEQVLESTE